MENEPNTPQNNQPTQPPQQPPVVSPGSLQTSPKPQKPLDRLKSNKVLIVVLAAIALLIIGGLVLASGNSKQTTDGTGKNAATPVFKNWLEPTSEIKVGDNRYVSPCQVLPLSQVADTMYDGKPPATLRISETYLDESPIEQKYSRPQTKCNYGDAVDFRAEQYFVAADTKRVGDTVSSLGAKYLDSRIAAYKRVTASSNDQDLKKFVAQLESSANTYKKYKDQFSRSATEKLDTSALIIPSGIGALEFTFYHDNVVYELKISTKVRASQIADATAEQLLPQLKQAKELISVVQQNAKNTQLSQSPAPTILSNKASVAKTYILEPCAVLTPAITKAITGIDQGNAIDRQSIPYDIATPQTTKAGYPALPRNACTRTVQAGEELSSNKTSIQLDIEYAPDAATLDKKLKGAKYLPLNPGDTQLQTNADFAAEYVVSGFDPLYYFRLGNYWMYLNMTTIDANGTQGKLSREQFVSAINLLVDSMKANIQEAESTQGR